MPIYKENKEKLFLNLATSDSIVKIKVNTFHGTVSGLTWIFNDDDFEGRKGEFVTIAKAVDLKGKTVSFYDSSNNPDALKIKKEYIISEENGNSLTYTFPDDYTGELPFNESDKNITNSFKVKFK